MQKKMLALLLAVITVFSATITCSAAFKTDSDITTNPVIVVPGFSSSALCYTDEDGNQTKVWALDFDSIFARVFKNPFNIIFGFVASVFGYPDAIADLVGEEFLDVAKYLACDENGESIYNLTNYAFEPEETNRTYCKLYGGDKSYQHEPEIMGEAINYIDSDNIFNFNCDFRMGVIACAERLNLYVKKVLEYTKAEKVNLYAISHGGQIVGTYLSLFAEENDIDNAVMTIPALGGAGIAYDVLNGGFDFDEELLMRFIEHGFMWEIDYHLLLKAQQLGFLDDVLDKVAPYFCELLGNWCSIWDFVPAEYYDTLKAELLDETENAGIIEKSDRVHYDIMPNYDKAFARCRELGMNVSIIAGAGHPVVTGLKQSSDAIITLNSSTGATCAPWGEQFPSDYTQVKNNDKYYISPSREIDASTAYLPDNTWIIDGLFHGMTYKDEYTKELMYTLMLTDRINSVWDDPNFPQFHATTNASSAIFGKFNAGKEGFVSDADNAFTVTNICAEHTVTVLSVKCDGVDLTFDKGLVRLKPGDSADISFTGEFPNTSFTTCTVTITYWESFCITPFGERTLDFTIMNAK